MSESIGIIAGSGQFPRLVAEDAKAAGYGVVVCAFHGFTDPGLEALADAYTTVYLGQFDKVIDYFRKHGVRRLCMAGAINKPRALDLRPDFRAARILFSLRGKGDDALLRAIMAESGKGRLHAHPGGETLHLPALPRRRPDPARPLSRGDCGNRLRLAHRRSARPV